MRQVAFTKRVNLSELSEGFDECYALVRPATRAEYSEAMDFDIEHTTREEQDKYEFEFIKSHFVSGKILVRNDEGNTELVDMEPDDVETSMALANKLYFEILGLKLDPKGSAKAA